MANNYKVKNFSNSTTNTSQVLFEASASTTLVKSIIVNCDKATPNATATLKLKKSGGSEELIKRVTVTSQDVSTELLYDVLPLEAGDELYATSSDTDLNFMMSWVENTNVAIGTALNALSDVDTTGVANGDVLTYNSTSGNWEAEAPAAGGDIFNTIAVAGQSSIVADSTTDTLTIAAGTGITLTTDAGTDTLTITNSATGANAFGNVAVAGQTTVAADSTNDTLTLAAAGGMTITTNATTDTITLDSARLDDDDVSLNGVRTVDLNGENFYFRNGSDTVIDMEPDVIKMCDVNVQSVYSAEGAFIRLWQASSNGLNYVGFKAPASLAASTSWILPSADGTSAQVLQTNGSGTLSFVSLMTTAATASVGAYLELKEAANNGTNYIRLQAPATLAADKTYTLPATDGSNGDRLTTDGSGTLSWSAVTSGASYSAVRTQSGTTYTLVLGDAGDYIQTTSTTAVTITVPTQASVTWAADTEIYFEQNNTGQITFVGASGVTINSSETLKTFARYSVVALKRVASDVWTLTGERALV